MTVDLCSSMGKVLDELLELYEEQIAELQLELIEQQRRIKSLEQLVYQKDVGE